MSLYPLYRPEEQPSLTGLVRQLLNNVSELIQQHIELTKTEIKLEAQRLSKAALFGLVAFVFLMVLLVCIGALGTILLESYTPLTWVGSATVMTVLYLGLLIVFGVLCLKQLQSAKQVLDEAHSEVPQDSESAYQ
jgi:uncharacterized membrane protein YqjE